MMMMMMNIDGVYYSTKKKKNKKHKKTSVSSRMAMNTRASVLCAREGETHDVLIDDDFVREKRKPLLFICILSA